jgi:hypothetical protein
MKDSKKDEFTEEAEKILFEELKAIWIWKGRKDQPHFLLSDGSHKAGYVNIDLILHNPKVKERLVWLLIKKLERVGITKEIFDVVYSSNLRGGYFGSETARQLDVKFIWTVVGEKRGQWMPKLILPPETRILQIEGNFNLGMARDGKREILNQYPGVKFVEIEGKTVAAAIIHSPTSLPAKFPDYEVIPLVEIEIPVWKAEKCPVCRFGSKCIKPPQNWYEFIAKYGE